MGIRFSGNVKFSNTSVRLVEPTVVEVPFTVETFTTAGAGSWVKPTGITEVVVECWGGGGAGGGAQPLRSAGGGGAGGQYAKRTIFYGSAQQTISYTVGASTTGTTGAGATGNDTTWATNVVIAKGGAGGGAGINQGNSTAGIGTTTGGVGDVIIPGENGSEGIYSPDLGLGDFVTGGGGGTGPGYFTSGLIPNTLSGFGGDAVFQVSSGGAPGGNGQNYAGGGGGAVKYSGANQVAGGGAQGVIRISYR